MSPRPACPFARARTTAALILRVSESHPNRPPTVRGAMHPVLWTLCDSLVRRARPTPPPRPHVAHHPRPAVLISNVNRACQNTRTHDTRDRDDWRQARRHSKRAKGGAGEKKMWAGQHNSFAAKKEGSAQGGRTWGAHGPLKPERATVHKGRGRGRGAPIESSLGWACAPGQRSLASGRHRT